LTLHQNGDIFTAMSKTKVRLTIGIDAEIYKILQKLARANERSLAATIRHELKKALKKNEAADSKAAE